MENYILYLKFLDKKLSKYFEAQSPYICCKKGCSLCCERGEYPYKQIEVEYLLYGFYKLPLETKQLIIEKIKNIKQEKLKNEDKDFMYECPFLINHECSVYEYRGIICRAFGLISSRENANSKVPFCAFEGLNYANVLDAETNTISEEKYLSLHIEQEPLAYNTGYKSLTSEKVEETLDFKFGEMRPLIDWLSD